jgi:hypothetical protein
LQLIPRGTRGFVLPSLPYSLPPLETKDPSSSWPRQNWNGVACEQVKRGSIFPALFSPSQNLLLSYLRFISLRNRRLFMCSIFSLLNS